MPDEDFATVSQSWPTISVKSTRTLVRNAAKKRPEAHRKEIQKLDWKRLSENGMAIGNLQELRGLTELPSCSNLERIQRLENTPPQLLRETNDGKEQITGRIDAGSKGREDTKTANGG